MRQEITTVGRMKIAGITRNVFVTLPAEVMNFHAEIIVTDFQRRWTITSWSRRGP